MKKLRLFGLLLLCAVALILVHALAKADDPLASGLLDTVFIISCAVIGVFLLRKANPGQTPIVRQSGSRRSHLSIEFPLIDSRGIIQIKDRRRLPDRRKAKDDINDLNAIRSNTASN